MLVPCRLQKIQESFGDGLHATPELGSDAPMLFKSASFLNVSPRGRVRREEEGRDVYGGKDFKKGRRRGIVLRDASEQAKENPRQ